MPLNVPGRRQVAPWGRDLFSGKAGAMSQQVLEMGGEPKLVCRQTVVQLRAGRPGALDGEMYCSPEYRAEILSVSRPHRLCFLADAPLTSSTFRSSEAGADLPAGSVAPVFGSVLARPGLARNVHALVCLSDDNVGFFGYANPEGILLVLQQDTDPIQAALKALSPTKYSSLVARLCGFTESEYGDSPPPRVIMDLYAQVRDFLAEIFSRPLDSIKEKVDFMLDALRALERERTRQLLVYEDAALVLNSVEALLLPFLDFGGQDQGDLTLLCQNQPYVIIRGDYMVYSFSDCDLLPEAALAECTEEDLPEAGMPAHMSMTRPRNLTRCVMTPADDPETLVEYCRFLAAHALPYVTQIPYAFSFLQPAAVFEPGQAPRPVFYELCERREKFDIQRFCQLAVQERIKRCPVRVYDLFARAPTDEELGIRESAPEKPLQGFLSQAEKALEDAMAREAARRAEAAGAESVEAGAEKGTEKDAEEGAGKAAGASPAEPANPPKPAEPPKPSEPPKSAETPAGPAIDTDAPVPARVAPRDSLLCATLAVMPPRTSVTGFPLASVFGPGAADVLVEAHYGRLMLGGSNFMAPGHYVVPRLGAPAGEAGQADQPDRAESAALGAPAAPEDVKLDIVAMSPMLQGKNVSLMLFGVPAN